MDPWLEDRVLWPGVHDALVVHLAETLTSALAPRYVARPGRRMVLEIPDRQAVPDVAVLEHKRGAAAASEFAADPSMTLVFDALEVDETYVEILTLRPARKVVAIIELLSHANKRSGTDSRQKYLRKQQEVLATEAHLVEIDLLRAGEPTVAIPGNHLASLPAHDYRVVVRRATARDRAEVYPIPLRHRLPRFPVPLLHPDPDAVVDLQGLLVRVYEAGAYALECGYARPADPPLSREDAAWAQTRIRGGGRKGRR